MRQLHVGVQHNEKGRAVERAIDAMRLDVGTMFGIAVPRVRIVPNPAMGPGSWRLDVNGVSAGSGLAGGINELLSQLRRSINRIVGHLVGIQETWALVSVMEPSYSDLVREATKATTLVQLAEVLRRLLDEQVSIANRHAILEGVTEWGPWEANTAVQSVRVRVGLLRQICYALAGADRDSCGGSR